MEYVSGVGLDAPPDDRARILYIGAESATETLLRAMAAAAPAPRRYILGWAQRLVYLSWHIDLTATPRAAALADIERIATEIRAMLDGVAT